MPPCCARVVIVFMFVFVCYLSDDHFLHQLNLQTSLLRGGLACLVLSVYPRMPRAARNRCQATRPAPSAMRRSQRNIRPPARLINPATSFDAAAVSSTPNSTIMSSLNNNLTHTTPSVTQATSTSNSIMASSSLIQDFTQAVTHQVLRTLSTHGVVAAGIAAPSAAPPSFQLPHDGALAAPLGATAGADASVRGRWHLSSIFFQVSLWGWGLRLQDRTGLGMFLPPTSLSIDCRVPAKLKAKIWDHEYFEFGLLLANSPTEPQYHLSVTTSEASGSAVLPTLCLEPTNKAKPLTSIDAWTSAFQIFVGVYTTKFPQEAPALMTYGEVVRDLAARGGGGIWRYYDTNFRYLKQQQPASLAWNVVHWELWIRSQNLSTTEPPRPSNGGLTLFSSPMVTAESSIVVVPVLVVISSMSAISVMGCIRALHIFVCHPLG